MIKHAGVFHHDVIEDFDAAGFRIDRNDRGVGRPGMHAGQPARRVAAGDFESMRIDIAGQIGRRQIERPRDVAQRDVAARTEHAAVANLHGFDIGLQHRRADRRHSPCKFLAGARGCTAGPDDAARAPGAARIGRNFGIAELDVNVGRGDAETLAGDLRQCRLQPLPDALDSGAHFKPSIRRDPGKHLLIERAPLAVGGGAMGGLFGEHGDAEADQPAVRFAAFLPGPDRRKADRLDRLAQKLRIVAAVEMLVGDVVERHLVGTDQIRQPDLVGLLADLPRDRVDHQLHGVADVRPRDAAIGKLRAFVGDDRGGLAAIDRNVVRARQDGADLRGLDRGGERVGRIGAGIDRGLGVERQELPGSSV